MLGFKGSTIVHCTWVDIKQTTTLYLSGKVTANETRSFFNQTPEPNKSFQNIDRYVLHIKFYTCSLTIPILHNTKNKQDSESIGTGILNEETRSLWKFKAERFRERSEQGSL